MLACVCVSLLWSLYQRCSQDKLFLIFFCFWWGVRWCLSQFFFILRGIGFGVEWCGNSYKQLSMAISMEMINRFWANRYQILSDLRFNNTIVVLTLFVRNVGYSCCSICCFIVWWTCFSFGLCCWKIASRWYHWVPLNIINKRSLFCLRRGKKTSQQTCVGGSIHIWRFGLLTLTILYSKKQK